MLEITTEKLTPYFFKLENLSFDYCVDCFLAFIGNKLKSHSITKSSETWGDIWSGYHLGCTLSCHKNVLICGPKCKNRDS